MQAYYIIPVPEAGGGPGQPPGIWGPPGPWPTPPIHIPGQPPHIWGPPGPWPTPPIANVPGMPGWPGSPGQPPGFWGPNDPRPTPPIHLPPNKPGDPPVIWPSPGVPTHPIVLPPDPPPQIWPDPPGKPPGGQTGSISNPINLPPAGAGGTQPGFWALAYFPELNGWVWVWVPAPTPPSGGDRPQVNPLHK